MISNLVARVHCTPREPKSSEFKYHPNSSVTEAIKVGLFTCQIGPWDERKNSRKVALTCSSCSRKFFQEWPIDTTNLRRHYEKKHGDVLNQLKREALSCGAQDYETVLSTSVSDPHKYNNPNLERYHTSTETSVNASIAGINTEEVSLTQSFKEEDYAALLVTASAKLNLPFEFFDYPEIRHIHSYLGRDPLPPSSLPAIRCYLDTLYKKEVDKVKELIGINTSRFAITIDEWDSGDHYDFLGVTLHFYNNNFNLVSYYIGFEVIPESSIPGVVLYKHLNNVLDEYTIKNRITSITRDNSVNMGVVLQNHLNYHRKVHKHNFDGDIPCVGNVLKQSASAVLEFTFFKKNKSRSFEHAMLILELDYSEWIDTLSGLASLPGTIRDIAHGVTHMPYLMSNFENIVRERRTSDCNTSAPMKLLRDNETRWLSTYDMLDRFLLFQPEVSRLLHQMGKECERSMLNLQTFNITDNQWKYLTILRDFLKIFRQPTLWLQGSDHPTINLVIPSIHVILKDLATFDFQGNPLIKPAAKEAEKTILRYFPITGDSIGSIKIQCLATVLDPRFKLEKFEEMNFSARAIKSIKQFFFDTFRRYKREYDEENKKHQQVYPETSSDESSNIRKIRKLANREYDEENDFDRRVFGGRLPVADKRNEAEAYLFEKRAAPEQRCLDYYQGNLHNYPVVCRMARDFLAIPATCAPAEALFSRVGKLTTKIHNPLETPIIKSFAILKSRGVLQDKRPPGIIYDLENNFSDDDDNGDDDYDDDYDDDDDDDDDDDQEDWVDEDEKDTEIESLLVGEDITKVFHESADIILSSESD